HLPLEGKNRTELIIAIVEREATPLNQYLPDAPTQLQEILTRALAKDKEKRYQSIKDLMNDLKSLKQELEGKLRRTDSDNLRSGHITLEIGRKRTGGTEGTGRATESIARQIIDRIRENKKQVGLVLLSLVLLTAAAGFGISLLNAKGKNIDSMAVLPFVNSVGDPELDYLSDGITESIINSLSQLPKLRVMARTTVFRYKGQQVDPEKVGRDLKVDAVLTGRVIQQGDTFIIQTELVNTADGRQLWGEKYNRKLL